MEVFLFLCLIVLFIVVIYSAINKEETEIDTKPSNTKSNKVYSKKNYNEEYDFIDNNIIISEKEIEIIKNAWELAEQLKTPIEKQRKTKPVVKPMSRKDIISYIKERLYYKVKLGNDTLTTNLFELYQGFSRYYIFSGRKREDIYHSDIINQYQNDIVFIIVLFEIYDMKLLPEKKFGNELTYLEHCEFILHLLYINTFLSFRFFMLSIYNDNEAKDYYNMCIERMNGMYETIRTAQELFGDINVSVMQKIKKM